jgi:hypothetical protein
MRSLFFRKQFFLQCPLCSFVSKVRRRHHSDTAQA